jgi:hypothetical protein
MGPGEDKAVVARRADDDRTLYGVVRAPLEARNNQGTRVANESPMLGRGVHLGSNSPTLPPIDVRHSATLQPTFMATRRDVDGSQALAERCRARWQK